jgi:hypothetical protein
MRVVLVALLAGLLGPASSAVQGVNPGHTTNPRPNPVIDPPDLD